MSSVLSFFELLALTALGL